ARAGVRRRRSTCAERCRCRGAPARGPGRGGDDRRGRVIAVQAGRILPEAQARRARAFVAGARPTVHARTAATVMLLRDTRRGLEVYVHLRHTAMAFAGGMIAFPGGCVDPGDHDPGSESADLPGWAEGLDTDPATARAFVRAAIRETHEETGVRLDPADLVPWARW